MTPLHFSRRTGHWRSSLSSKALDARGGSIPWYTYPAIDFLAERDYAGSRVLEFGGGQSTLWWSERADEVICIEEDEGWYRSLATLVSPNVELHHIPRERIDDVTSLLASKGVRYDVIIVDGHLRREVAVAARPYLADTGAMILDNAEHYCLYEETSGWNLRRVDFYGFAPGVRARHCTAVLFASDCFLFDPTVPISIID